MVNIENGRMHQGFSIYKDENGALKEPSWKLIEYHTLELGLHILHGQIRGQCETAKAKWTVPL